MKKAYVLFSLAPNRYHTELLEKLRGMAGVLDVEGLSAPTSSNQMIAVVELESCNAIRDWVESIHQSHEGVLEIDVNYVMKDANWKLKQTFREVAKLRQEQEAKQKDNPT